MLLNICKYVLTHALCFEKPMSISILRESLLCRIVMDEEMLSVLSLGIGGIGFSAIK